jgi:hypothetical protein
LLADLAVESITSEMSRFSSKVRQHPHAQTTPCYASAPSASPRPSATPSPAMGASAGVPPEERKLTRKSFVLIPGSEIPCLALLARRRLSTSSPSRFASRAPARLGRRGICCKTTQTIPSPSRHFSSSPRSKVCLVWRFQSTRRSVSAPEHPDLTIASPPLPFFLEPFPKCYLEGVGPVLERS